MNSRYPLVKMSQFLRLRKEFFTIDDAEEYRLVTVQLHARGIRKRSHLLGSEIKTKKQQRVKSGDLLVAEIDAKVGGYGIVPPELNGAIVSGHYFLYEIDQHQIIPEYFGFYLQTGYPEQDLQQFVKGSVNYAAIRSQHFFELEIPLPPLEDQWQIVEKILYVSKRLEDIKSLQQLSDQRITQAIHSLINSIDCQNNENRVYLGDVLKKIEDLVYVDDEQEYQQVTVRLHHQGLVRRQKCMGKDIKTKKQYRVRTGQFLYSRIDARNGAMGLVPSLLDKSIVSNDFPVFVTDNNKLDPRFLNYYSSTDTFMDDCITQSKGTSNRQRLKEERFLQIKIPLPPLDLQLKIVAIAEKLEQLGKRQALIKEEMDGLFKSVLDRAFIGDSK